MAVQEELVGSTRMTNNRSTEDAASRLLTTREYADALDLSESSVKRWADEGLLRVTRTPGGHRRIDAREGIRFARQGKLAIVRPAVVGLSPVPRNPSTEVASFFTDLLRDGDFPDFQAALLERFVAGESVATLGDEYLSPAFEEIGRLWLRSEEGIFIEHLAVEAAIAGLHQIRNLIPAPSTTDASVAIGGTPEGDPYLLSSLLVSMVFLEHGIKAINLGANVPVKSLQAAITSYDPEYVWLSFRGTTRAAGFDDELSALMGRKSNQARGFLLGGPEVPSLKRRRGSAIVSLPTLGSLEALLKGREK